MKIRHIITGSAPSFIAAAIGSAASVDAKDVYEKLDKPSWAPPAKVFGPVWSGLYLLIGYCGTRMKKTGVARKIWVLHCAQLALNAGWTWAFFKGRNKAVSLAVISTLDALLVLELIALWRRDRRAALALMPYAAWVSFATALNTSVEGL